LAAVIRRVGPCRLAERQPSDHLTALVIAIVNQQLSTKAAATIFSRLVALFPDHAISASTRSLGSAMIASAASASAGRRWLPADLCTHIHEAAFGSTSSTQSTTRALQIV
jgi:DNA-3-methyladenine glycosylase II